MANSLIDYLFRRLAIEYLPHDVRAGLGVLGTSERTQQTLPGVDEATVPKDQGHELPSVRTTTTRSALVLAVAAVLLTGCSSDDDDTASSTTSASRSTATTASSDSTETTAGGSSSAGSPIPDSAAVTALVKGSDPKRYDLIAKCNEVAAVVLGKKVGVNDDPTVKSSLDRLVVVVRPIDPAVADALAEDATSAAAWCKAEGMTNT